MNKILKLFLSAIIFFSLATPVMASDLEVSCNGTSCTSSPTNGPLFAETNILPLDVFTRTLKATNTSTDNLNFAIQVINPFTSDSTPTLSDVISIIITEQEASSVVYGPKTLSQWQSDGFQVLSNIPAGEERNYIFTATFANVGNDYQSKTLKFDINLGFDALATEQTPTPTPNSTPIPAVSGSSTTNTPTPAIGGYSCQADPPTVAPDLNTFQSSPNTVLLNWSDVPGATHYAIRYGISAGNYIYGANNVGNTHSFVVSELSSATQYYFQVAGVNDCAFGPWSGEKVGSVQGVVLTGPASGFVSATEAGVLGTTTDVTPTPLVLEGGSVKGESTCTEPYYRWWWPLVLEALLIFSYYLFIKDRTKRPKFWWLIPTALALISQWFHNILGCTCATGKWCPYFWVFNLIILTSLTFIYLRYRKKPPANLATKN